jgi:predicted DNA binding CopG/RHH family protein
MAKKTKSKKQPNAEISPLQTVKFLEDMRKLSANTNEATVPISLRVPANLLRALKTRAKIDGKAYQSLIISLIRTGLER